MSRPGEAIHAIYVDPDGLIRSGRVVIELQREGEEGPVLMSRAGRALRPTDILALLEPRSATEDQRAFFSRAAAAGYRVENF